jgi:hypothetical protein
MMPISSDEAVLRAACKAVRKWITGTPICDAIDDEIGGKRIDRLSVMNICEAMITEGAN